VFSPEASITILFEDEHLCVVDKPSGIPCHPTLDPRRPHLMGVLQAQRQNSSKLILLHRLDVDTSGVLILAKTSEANLRLQEDLKNRRIEKYYWAVSEVSKSRPSKSVQMLQQEILNSQRPVIFKNHLAIVKKNKKDFTEEVRSGGDLAISSFRLLKKESSWLSFEVQLLTGRKHQIRSHLKSLHWPILGDRLYNLSLSMPVPRLALHSWRCVFQHPVLGNQIEVESSRPLELGRFL